MDEKRLAILIDAENISYRYAKTILDEASSFGNVTFKRIYGDWSSPQLQSWKGVLLENGIHPMQQCSYTMGKNSTDSAIIIDAMDILYGGRVDGFCLVTSDSDFTGLATRLKESGMLVIGMGMQHTPKPMISACSTFKYLDKIAAQIEVQPEKKAPAPVVVQPAPQPAATPPEDDIVAIIKELIASESDEDGWMLLSDVGTQLPKRKPDFDVRNYGHKKMVPFLSSFNQFEIKKVSGKANKQNPNGQIIYVRTRT
ncbi:MAG: NYN domain-containing protein [Eubacteriales bacterium]